MLLCEVKGEEGARSLACKHVKRKGATGWASHVEAGEELQYRLEVDRVKSEKK